MITKYLALIAGVTLGLMTREAHASFILNVEQVENDVVVRGQGFVDLSGLTPVGSTTQFNTGLVSVDNHNSYGNERIASGGGSTDLYYLPSLSPFGLPEGQNYRTATSSSGDAFYLALTYNSTGQAQVIGVPSGYNSSEYIYTYSIYAGKTIEGLGLKEGTYEAKWSSDTLTLNIGVSPVPLPGSAPLFGAALIALGAIGYGLNRKNKAAA